MLSPGTTRSTLSMMQVAGMKDYSSTFQYKVPPPEHHPQPESNPSCSDGGSPPGAAKAPFSGALFPSSLLRLADVPPGRLQQPRRPAGGGPRGSGSDGLLARAGRLREPLEGRALLPGTTRPFSYLLRFLMVLLALAGADLGVPAARPGRADALPAAPGLPAVEGRVRGRFFFFSSPPPWSSCSRTSVLLCRVTRS